MGEIAPWSETKFITYSSFLFTLPTFYFISRKQLIYPSYMLFITSIISANFWRHAIYDWRRTLDIYFSKIMFSYFFFHGALLIPTPWSYLSNLNTICLSYCYYQSENQYKKKNKKWVQYHVAFHGFMTSNLFLILPAMQNYYVNKYFQKLT